MISAFKVLKEQINSFYLMIRLSMYELKIKNNNNYLGMLWEVINPAIQVAVYWMVFGMGIRQGKSVGTAGQEVPFLQWLVAGIIVWFFISPAILNGSKSIYTRIKIIAKMNFPLSVIPSYVIFSIFYPNVMLLAVIAVIFQFTDHGKISLYYLQLPYYMVAAIALVFSLSLITSTLSTIVRDVQMFVQSIMRMLFYITPILWVPKGDKLPEFIKLIIKGNPFNYIVEGYRDALLSRAWFFEHWEHTLYFWGFVLVLFIIGSALHVKLRNRFVDYL
ncbi:teichoic acid transport system permease protein [Fictibacillus enclensis]|uniref:Transport permease protein n=1 Tax=Fictibacillus enclensis TaxID=1017270 RepID=A0A0V8J7M0_9BACL|nr:ABC transporter permease [Fictibacillus enclensis]KSU83070.1 teichoic acid ABC transporter permease [Fictibacillus enclensis]SCC09688.1 teichoic acid transport system permease protein [Fictibacillus enclensis]